MTIPRNYNTGNNYFLIKFEIRGTSSSDWHVGAMMDTQLSYDRKKNIAFTFANSHLIAKQTLPRSRFSRSVRGGNHGTGRIDVLMAQLSSVSTRTGRLAACWQPCEPAENADSHASISRSEHKNFADIVLSYPLCLTKKPLFVSTFSVVVFLKLTTPIGFESRFLGYMTAKCSRVVLQTTTRTSCLIPPGPISTRKPDFTSASHVFLLKPCPNSSVRQLDIISVGISLFIIEYTHNNDT